MTGGPGGHNVGHAQKALLIVHSGVRIEQCNKYCHQTQARVMDTRYVIVAAALFCLVELPVSA